MNNNFIDDIILISDNEILTQTLSNKMRLIRNSDKISSFTYENILHNPISRTTNVVFLHENKSKEKTFHCIQKIKQENQLASIILLTNDYDKNFILQAFEAGISDFTKSDAEDFELVIRAVNNIQTSIQNKLINRYEKILKKQHIINETTNFYNANSIDLVFSQEIKSTNNGIVLILETQNNTKSKTLIENVKNAIKISLRKSDLTAFDQEKELFYILLPNTTFSGAISVIEKIKKKCSEEISLKVGMSEYFDKSFKQVKNEAYEALKQVESSQVNYLLFEENETKSNDYNIEQLEEKPKNYKFFQQIFDKKLEQIITPIFYRQQKFYEEKLANTQIMQSCENNKCVFNLKNNFANSSLKITYSGYTKIQINFIHQGLDSPENKEFTLSVAKINKEDITKIIDDFILDFETIKE
ncbi:MAG: hypothetical protein R3Y28_03035 [Candidatus Gastranaerophilales bacterium]